jgi:RING finger protein 113A
LGKKIISLAKVPSTETKMSASASPSPAETAVTAPITFKQRGRRAKGSFRKRPASSTIEPARGSPDDSSSSSDEHDTLEGPRIKRGKEGVVSTSTNVKTTPSEDHGPTAFQAKRDIPLSDINDATKRKDWYDQPTTKGPARAASNVRITTTTDFARDVCKDYKKTGWVALAILACSFMIEATRSKAGNLIGSGSCTAKRRSLAVPIRVRITGMQTTRRH